MEDAKFYGLCLMRLRNQITNARSRRPDQDGRVLMESYRTGDPDDIIDILELYDIEGRIPGCLMEKLEELAYTASVLIRETLSFDYDSEGHLGLYLKARESSTYTETEICNPLAVTAVIREDSLPSLH